MKKLRKGFFSILLIILTTFFCTLNIEAAEAATDVVVVDESIEEAQNEFINTVNITMPILTDTIERISLSNNEIEKLIHSSCEKALEPVESITIDHTSRNVSIIYEIDATKGDVTDLINISLYNFFSLLNDFDLYNFHFEIYVKSMDSNMRVSKARYSSYTFNSENLISLNLEELTHHEFVLYADKTWVNNEGKEGYTKAIETDDLQLKIINILKSYIQYKISD